VIVVPRERFQEDLDGLRGQVLELGEAVEKQVADGLRALDTDDKELARAVVDGDDAINDRYLELESDCIHLFALQQPVAGDLRIVASSFKILTDLERIGDLATNFGKYTITESHASPPDDEVIEIGWDALEMVVLALDAYENDDVERCYDVARRDDHVDALCQHASEEVVRDLIGREWEAGDAWGVEHLLDDVARLLLTIRDIERVGDHAVNIAARTLYLIDQDSTLLY
jgi:phosphate transport system protein